MLRALLTLAILGLTIYAVLDCVRSEESKRTPGPTWMWVALIIILPLFGALIWLAISRAAEAAPGAPRRTIPLAPDDDPEFLRYLRQRNKPGDKKDSDGRPHGEDNGG